MDKNKLGSMPINKLVLEMSIPIMISMLIQALYNLVDSLFIAHMATNSEAAITALSLAFPMQSMIIAVTVGTGIGLNAVLSRTFGEKRYDRMNLVAGNGIFLGLVTGLVFFIAGLTVVRPYFEMQTSNQLVVEMGIEYMTIVVCFGVAKVFQIFLERILQATGRPKLSMISQASAALLNCILDPFFIFGLDMGIRGAAIATILAQVIGAIICLILNIRKNEEITFKFEYIKPVSGIIKEIYKIGIPAILIQAIQSVTVFFINGMLYTISETCVTAYGLYFKLNGMIYMPIFGINNGIISIIGYNYGANKPERIKHTMIYALKFSCIILGIGMLIFNIIPDRVAMMFKPSDELLGILISCLRISSLAYLFFAVNVIIQSGLQAVGEGMTSLVLTILRTVIIVLPAVYLLARLPNAENLVWIAIPASEAITAVVSVIVFKRIYNNKIVKSKI